MKDNPILLLNKEKVYLKEVLTTNSIEYFEYPYEQRKVGLDVIEVGDTLFWFDCDSIIYRITINLEENKFKFPIKFDNRFIVNDVNFDEILPFLNKMGEKFSERKTEDYKLIAYKINHHMLYIFNVQNNIITGFSINYDGYSRYQYKKGISLSDYLKSKIDD